jgi:hypothetical protein
MRPGTLKRALVVIGCGVLAVSASACESTEDESAKVAREEGAAAASAGASTLKLGTRNRDVRVSDVTLLNSGGRSAVAVKLTSRSAHAQLDVPILVNVTGAGDRVLYSNATSGVEPLLQKVSLLPPHASVWWVDDQVLIAGAATGTKVSVGSGRNAAAATGAQLSAGAARVGEQSGMSVVSGELFNHTGRAQAKVAVFAAAVRADKVVAAGRAVVESVAGSADASARFQVFMVGDPAGAKIELTAAPPAR